MPEAGRYLVAVARGLNSDSLAGVTGLRGLPLRLVSQSTLQAVVCDVDLEEFGEQALRQNLENLSWVEEMARAHHAAVCAVHAAATTVPMRFGTIYESDERVVEQLQTLATPLTEALNRVEGAAEWSVKAFTADPLPDASAATRPESGAAYLLQRREAAEARRAREIDDEQFLSTLHQRLATLAVASRRLLPQDPRLSGRREPMRMNAAYLVTHADADSFCAFASTGLDDRPGLRLDVAGPWPPYSFASLEPA